MGPKEKPMPGADAKGKGDVAKPAPKGFIEQHFGSIGSLGSETGAKKAVKPEVIDRVFDHFELLKEVYCPAGLFPESFFNALHDNLDQMESWVAENLDNEKVLSDVEDYLTNRFLTENPGEKEKLAEFIKELKRMKTDPNSERKEFQFPKKENAISETEMFMVILLQHLPPAYHQFIGVKAIDGKIVPQKKDLAQLLKEASARREDALPPTPVVSAHRELARMKVEPKPPESKPPETQAAKTSFLKRAVRTSMILATGAVIGFFAKELLVEKPELAPTPTKTAPTKTAPTQKPKVETKVNIYIDGERFAGSSYQSPCTFTYSVRDGVVSILVTPYTPPEKPKAVAAKPKPKPAAKQKPKPVAKKVVPSGVPDSWALPDEVPKSKAKPAKKANGDELLKVE